MTTVDYRTSETAGDAAARTERARRAVAAFRRMQPMLNNYARAFTGNPRVTVEVVSDSNGATDGKKIFFRPPIALGDEHKHNKKLCDKRDSDTLLQLCKACEIREQILVVIYHEIAHICYGTFAMPSEQDQAELLRRAVEASGSKYADAIAKRIQQTSSYVRHSYLAMAGQISPFLPIILNAVEDARVNNNLFNARRGTRVMFDADTVRTFNRGVESQNPDGSVTYTPWDEREQNLQLLVGLYCAISGYEYGEWFIPPVAAALDDTIVQELIEQARTTSSVEQNYGLSFKFLERFRQLGFCKLDTDPEDEEEQPQPDEESDEQSDDTESDESDDSEDTDESEEDGEQDDQGQRQESEEPGDVDDPEGAPDPEAEGETNSTDDGGQGTNDETEAEEDSAPSNEEAAPGEDPEGESDSVAGDQDGSGSDDPGTDDERLDNDSDSSGDDEFDSEEYAGEESDSDEESGDGSDPGYDDGDSTTSTRGPGDAESVASDSFDEDDSEDEYLYEDEDAEEEFEREDGDEDSEPIDTGADEGLGGIEVEEDPANDLDAHPMGTAEEVQQGLDYFGHHEAKEESAQDKLDEQALQTAILQGTYFETPSANIEGVRVHEYGKPVLNAEGHNMSTAWGGKLYEYGYSRKDLGIDGDFKPEESIIGRQLLRLRVVFADNQRAQQQNHLKAGRVNTRVLGRRAPLGDERLFRKKTIPGKKSYFVAIALDISGSTVGKNLALIKAAAWAQADLLTRLGIPFAMYGCSGYYGSTSDASNMFLDMYPVKLENEAWNARTQERLQELGPDGANLDGHNLEFMRKLCDKSTATDSIIMYYSDGKMPASNYEEELELLQRELKYCKQRGHVVAGVGIRCDSPARHGLPTVQIDHKNDIGKVVSHLEKMLRARL